MPRFLSIALFLSLFATPLPAEEPPAFEEAAEAATKCVATVRILDIVPDKEDAKATRPHVTVCTGVCVEKGWIVAPAFAGSDSQIRLTLPGGQQSQGQLRVIDEYSGLALLEADTHDLKPIKAAAAPVKVGAWVLSAAAWGVEQPVVSFGVMSGKDRTVGGMQYPPLLQADLRTTETSGGAALINCAGELVGIVALVDEGKDRRGWTYAVPANHVERLLRTRLETKAQDKPMTEATATGERRSATGERRLGGLASSVVVLKRRRPVVGVELDGIGESVTVMRVFKGTGAEKAGFLKGDVVQSVDGIKIRSVYQAGQPVLFKQPGDLVVYEVLRDGKPQTITVTLGGGVELPSAPREMIGEYIRPKVDIEGLGDGRYAAKSGRDEVREVFGPGETEDRRTAEEKAATPAAKIKLLERALDSYRAVITNQQAQIIQREQERRAMEERVKELEKEVEALKK